MLTTVFIIAIFFEIVITSFLVIKIIEAQKKVEGLEIQMLFNYRLCIEAGKKLRESVCKLNKFVAFFTNKKFILIKNIAFYSIEALKFVFLIKSLNLSKGLKAFNFKNIRKVLVTRLAFQLLQKIISKC